ncbi:MAG: hypothetical protein OXU45_10065 [Candidatus Melainabacteria bacterium]|nr:hypothetical protein [Candidatus Melainabacteria bacterium]
MFTSPHAWPAVATGPSPQAHTALSKVISTEQLNLFRSLINDDGSFTTDSPRIARAFRLLGITKFARCFAAYTIGEDFDSITNLEPYIDEEQRLPIAQEHTDQDQLIASIARSRNSHLTPAVESLSIEDKARVALRLAGRFFVTRTEGPRHDYDETIFRRGLGAKPMGELANVLKQIPTS